MNRSALARRRRNTTLAHLLSPDARHQHGNCTRRMCHHLSHTAFEQFHQPSRQWRTQSIRTLRSRSSPRMSHNTLADRMCNPTLAHIYSPDDRHQHGHCTRRMCLKGLHTVFTKDAVHSEPIASPGTHRGTWTHDQPISKEDSYPEVIVIPTGPTDWG